MKPHNRRHHRSLTRVLALVLLVGVTGCSSTPKIAHMIPEGDDATFASTDAALVVGTVQGGEASSAWEGSRISASEYRLALIQALQQSNLFTEVAAEAGGEADYELATFLLSQQQPAGGFGMTVDLVVRYQLIDRRTGSDVFNDKVVSSYRAGVGDAFVGTKRLRKANEGAVRENIKQLLQQIDGLSLGADRVSSTGQ